MMNSIKKILALALSVLMFASAFGAFAEEELADDTVLLTYNGGEVLYGEASDYVNANVAAMIMEYSYMYMLYYGTTYTPTEQEYLAAVNEAIFGYAQREILYAKMLELEIPDFTEEQKAEFRAQAQSDYDQMIASYVSAGMAEEAAKEEIAKQYITMDLLYEDIVFSNVLENLKKTIVYDTEVTEEDVTSAFNELVEEAKTTYKNNPVTIENLVNQNKTYYYIPEGCKYVKHILVPTEDEALQAEYQAAVTAVNNYETEIATLTAPSYEPKYVEVIEKAMLDEAKENLELAEKALEALKAEYLESISGKLDEINKALEAGESFDSLIEKYSIDEGSLEEPIKTNGYFVHAKSPKLDPAFLEAVNSLENTGDISEPAMSSYGAHIVLYFAEAPEGPIDIETVRESIEATILPEREKAAYSDQFSEWITEANIQFVQ